MAAHNGSVQCEQTAGEHNCGMPWLRRNCLMPDQHRIMLSLWGAHCILCDTLSGYTRCT